MFFYDSHWPWPATIGLCLQTLRHCRHLGPLPFGGHPQVPPVALPCLARPDLCLAATGPPLQCPRKASSWARQKNLLRLSEVLPPPLLLLLCVCVHVCVCACDRGAAALLIYLPAGGRGLYFSSSARPCDICTFFLKEGPMCTFVSPPRLVFLPQPYPSLALFLGVHLLYSEHFWRLKGGAGSCTLPVSAMPGVEEQANLARRQLQPPPYFSPGHVFRVMLSLLSFLLPGTIFRFVIEDRSCCGEKLSRQV